ncbi:hypothetical protein QJS10_CPA01g01163 [Acorus calamus]|uniref:Uncharacterized protein n=1 Tax=Acorus calamus TaxID=4465 RepID=A0AAV9FLR4_ACOCL|nr:hypothetical protein QJS10_CPA01g01163 [Acorus calamus]
MLFPCFQLPLDSPFARLSIPSLLSLPNHSSLHFHLPFLKLHYFHSLVADNA